MLKDIKEHQIAYTIVPAVFSLMIINLPYLNSKIGLK